MIISLNLGNKKQGNLKIRELLDDKIMNKVRPRMHKKQKPQPKKKIKINYSVNTEYMTPLFVNWLENNASKFRFKPYVKSIKKDSVEVFFDGIPSESISAELYLHGGGYAGFRISAEQNGVFYDWLLDFDVMLMRDRNGYYCEFCTPLEYYETEERLAQHLFDGVLRWCNKNLDCAKGISFYGSSEKGFYWAELVLNDAVVDNAELIKYIPFQ